MKKYKKIYFNKEEKINLNHIQKLLIIGFIFFFFILYSNNHCIKQKRKLFDKNFINEVQNIFTKNQKVNINQIEEKFHKSNILNKDIISTINIGFTLDPGYILETILTTSSIMSTQNKTTKIRFHFGVTKNFNITHMMKLYELRNRINNLTEFSFYYLKESVEKMKNFHEKGEACPGKFELPQLLPDDVERLIIFDAGDVLILRDLSELYNYNMQGYWALAPPEPFCIYHIVLRRNIKKYLNIGSILLNVNELKKNNFWDIYVKNRNIPKGGMPDQTLFNLLVPDNKKDYFPFRFGVFSLFCSDYNSDRMKWRDFNFDRWLNSELSENFPQKPSSEIGILAQSYNPLFIHQFCDKWSDGGGLTIYRHLAKYFLNISGVKEELCKKKPGYCL